MAYDLSAAVCPVNGLPPIEPVLGVPTAVVALAASVMILIFIHILSTLLQNRNMTLYVKLELYEVVMSAVILIVIGTLVTSACTFKVGTLFPTNDDDLKDKTIYFAADQYFTDVGAMIAGWMQVNYVIGVYMDQMASTTPYSRPLGVGLVATPLAGIGTPLKQLVYNMMLMLSIAMVINYAQQYVLRFAVVGFVSYYFPIGIFLRCFTPTRRIGGTLLGMGFGFMFVLPFITTLASIMFLDPVHGNLTGFDSAMGDYWSRNNLEGKMSNFFTNLSPSKTSYFTNLVKGEIFNLIGGLMAEFLGLAVVSAFLIPLSSVGTAFALGFFIQAINTIIAVQAIRSLSRTFGEEIDVTTLTRLI